MQRFFFEDNQRTLAVEIARTRAELEGVPTAEQKELSLKLAKMIEDARRGSTLQLRDKE
jgi:hypothetical protein